MTNRKYKTKLHKQLYEQYKGRCAYCNKKINDSSPALDHFIPQSKGGYTNEFNLLPVCTSCNSRKYNMQPYVWLESIEKSIGITASRLRRLKIIRQNLRVLIQDKLEGEE